jgi:hypothetical protein
MQSQEADDSLSFKELGKAQTSYLAHGYTDIVFETNFNCISTKSMEALQY